MPKRASPQNLFDRWNAFARQHGLPVAKVLTETRRRHLRNVRDDWDEVLAAVAASPFCLGENDRGWTADLDFLCSPTKRAKLIEGAYRGSPKRRGTADPERAIASMMTGKQGR